MNYSILVNRYFLPNFKLKTHPELKVGSFSIIPQSIHLILYLTIKHLSRIKIENFRCVRRFPKKEKWLKKIFN